MKTFAVGSHQVPFPGAPLSIRCPAAVKYISQFVAGINVPCGLPTKAVDKHAGRRVTLTMSRRPAAVNFVAGLVSVHDRPFASTFFGVNGSAAVKPGCPHQGVAYVAGASPEHPAKLVAGVVVGQPPTVSGWVLLLTPLSSPPVVGMATVAERPGPVHGLMSPSATIQSTPGSPSQNSVRAVGGTFQGEDDGRISD